MLSLKWKIFRVINFIQLFFAFFIFVVMLKFIFDFQFIFPEFLYILPSVAIISNCYLNLHILRRYFPDKLLPFPLLRFSKILLIINILIGVGMMGLIYIGADSEFNSGDESPEGKLVLVFVTLVWLLLIYILILQFQVGDFLKTNNRDKMEKLIDSIGHAGD